MISFISSSGKDAVPAVAALVVEDVQAGGEADTEDHHDAEQDEAAGHEGDLVPLSAGQCAGHG